MSFEHCRKGTSRRDVIVNNSFRLMYDWRAHAGNVRRDCLIFDARTERCTEAMTPEMPPRAASRRAGDEDEIVRRIHNAVIEQRLPAGHQAVGGGALRGLRRRPRARSGAACWCSPAARSSSCTPTAAPSWRSPTAEQARDVFDARRAIEPGDRASRHRAARPTATSSGCAEHLAAEAERARRTATGGTRSGCRGISTSSSPRSPATACSSGWSASW